jgi:hypothetical protein
MTFTKTEKILVSGCAVFFVSAILSHFFVRLTELQAPLWATFGTCWSALMLCLKTDEKTVDPILSGVATQIGEELRPYVTNFSQGTAYHDGSIKASADVTGPAA